MDDIEPNGSAANANMTSEGEVESGDIGYGYYVDDDNDYYQVVMEANGLLTITADFETEGSVYLLHQNGGSAILVSTTPNVAGPNSVSLELDCVAKNDIFYIRITEAYGVCSGYEFSYNIEEEPIYVDDAEPNGSAGMAGMMNEGIIKSGDIGYGYYVDDDNDYYQIVMEANGLLTITADFETEGSVYLLHQNGGSAILVSTTPNVTGRDTVTVVRDCVAKNDIFYIRVTEAYSICSGYQVSYEIEEPAFTDVNDVEPNDTKATAYDIGGTYLTIHGHIDYGYYDDDNNDYFNIGALAVGDSLHLDFSTESGAVTFYLYREGTTAIVKSFGAINGMAEDDYNITIDDTYYIRATGSSCMGYSVNVTGCENIVEYDGAVIDDYRQAQTLISAQNSIVNPSAIFNAPIIDLLGGFDVPLGNTLETQQDGCGVGIVVGP